MWNFRLIASKNRLRKTRSRKHAQACFLERVLRSRFLDATTLKRVWIPNKVKMKSQLFYLQVQ